MAEFIGARISLVSRSDIRYVGTLHEINSETSTVALENVTSYGTEGRKSDPTEEIPPADVLYEYIVFRGSDVKDLRIEEAPAAKENKPPQVPNDPAILGSGSRPPAHNQGQAPAQSQQAPVLPGAPQQGPPPQGGPPGGPPFGQPSQYPPFYPPPPAGWGRGGPPGPPGPPGPGFPGMPYGAPPGWYPPAQGYPHPPPFPPYGYPLGPPGQQFQQGPEGQPPRPAPIGPGANKQPSPASAADKQAEQKPAAKVAADLAVAAAAKPPTPPVASKPSVAEVQASAVHPNASQGAAAVAASKAAPTGPKSNRIQPVLPLQAPAAVKAPLQGTAGNVAAPVAVQGSASLRDATQAATAAVAAAMAKLPTTNQANGNAMDNLTKKVNEMRTNDPIRTPRHPGSTGGFAGRGRGRGGARQASAKVEVPATDFDFESSNAKFNKHDLVKEAIAGSPLGEHPPVGSPVEVEDPLPGYNKSTSFFDNISSESRDRMDSSGARPGGREWRGEEQKKNVETFGQGSVDNGYRGGYRGRGGRRGGFRGRGYGGNGQPGRGRGGYRGRGDAQFAEQ